MSESEAVSLAQLGDSSAFEFLYRLHQPNVFRCCCKMLKDSDEAEDMAQEIFLHLWQKISLYNRKSTFATWLYKLTTNKVIEHVRRKNARIPEGSGEFVQTSILPNQHVRLEIMESLDGLTDLQLLCVEAEWSGQSLKKHGGAGHLRNAKREMEGYLI